jgi:class 3 adenylate cyclase
MIFMTEGPASPYYAGLDLVALLSVFFIPYAPIIQAAALSSIYLPYYLACAFFAKAELASTIFIHTSFMMGTALIALVIRQIGFRTRCSEVEAQLALAKEIANRENVIVAKTAETVKLSKLSNQFSPQVVEAIRLGSLELSKEAKRKLICAICIDIVNSTERVVRLDKDKVHRVMSMFLEDTVRILLKYDITVDKFLGDGILAFSNDPVPYDDFIERTVRAAIEIQEHIQHRQEEYEINWMNRLEIRVGVSTGYANTGFYGNEKFFKCYTAIGPVINLACRLCAAAEPNQILTTYDVVETLPSGLFETKFVGKRTLKGFDNDIIRCYSISGYSNVASKHSIDTLDCPSCENGILFLDTNDSGLFVFKCRHCGLIQDKGDSPNVSRTAV